MDITAGVVTAVVAIVGILASVGAPILHERRRWQHEARLAFRAQRSGAERDLLVAAERCTILTRDMAERRGPTWLLLAETRRNRLQTAEALRDAGNALLEALASLRLVATRDVVEAAEFLLEAVATSGTLLEQRDPNPTAWDAALDEVKAERERFLTVCRADRGQEG